MQGLVSYSEHRSTCVLFSSQLFGNTVKMNTVNNCGMLLVLLDNLHRLVTSKYKIKSTNKACRAFSGTRENC